MIKPDACLIKECLSGDRRAWEKLVARYSRLLYCIPLRCGLSQEDAADIFQNVCVKLLANLDKVKDEKHLTGWLITTTRHECLHVLRQKKRQYSRCPSTIEDPKLSMLPAEEPYPEEAIVQLEEQQMVRVAVEDMGHRCRTLIELLYLNQPPASYAEVSQRMDMPTGAIGPTRARCLKNLKDKLVKAGF